MPLRWAATFDDWWLDTVRSKSKSERGAARSFPLERPLEPPHSATTRPKLFRRLLLGQLAFAQANAGRAKEAGGTLARADATASWKDSIYTMGNAPDEPLTAAIYARLGQPDAAVQWLNAGIKRPRGPFPIHPAIDPKLIILHGKSRVRTVSQSVFGDHSLTAHCARSDTPPRSAPLREPPNVGTTLEIINDCSQSRPRNYGCVS